MAIKSDLPEHICQKFIAFRGKQGNFTVYKKVKKWIKPNPNSQESENNPSHFICSVLHLYIFKYYTIKNSAALNQTPLALSISPTRKISPFGGTFRNSLHYFGHIHAIVTQAAD